MVGWYSEERITKIARDRVCSIILLYPSILLRLVSMLPLLSRKIEGSLEPVLQVRNLVYTREDKLLFNNFDLEINPGQWVVIRGANGIGKTTLLKLISGLLTPDSGEIRNKPLAYLGHKNGHRPYMKVRDQLYSKAKLLKVDADIDILLKQCGLTHLQDMRICELSAGQQRQVALASLLLSQNPLWLVDEPFSNLDEVSRALFMDVFSQHVQSGGAICQTSHTPIPLSYGVREIVLDLIKDFFVT